MIRVIVLLVVVAWSVVPAAGDACRYNTWQPTYVHDLVNNDGVPYYVMPDGRFVALTGDWTNQSGPGMCCLYGVRDTVGFTDCFAYTRVQCGCDLQSLANDTCRRFLTMRGSIQSPAQGLVGRWQGCDGRVVEFTEVGGVLRGTYLALGGLGTYGFIPGEVGYEARQVSPGVYEGQVLWKGAGNAPQWRPNRIFVQGDDYSDVGSDNCSRNMRRVR
jgi:hypothetical protein